MTPHFELPIPMTLDAIVTRNRGECEIGLATRREVSQLRGEIDAPIATRCATLKKALPGWHITDTSQGER